MLVMTKKSILSDSVDYQNTGPKMNFLSVLRTLVIGILSRQSMLQINGCDRKSAAYS